MSLNLQIYTRAGGGLSALDMPGWLAFMSGVVHLEGGVATKQWVVLIRESFV